MSSTDVGKVGIANEYPEALLDVNGSVKIRDKIDLTQHKISNVGKIQFTNLTESYDYDSGYSTGNIYSYSFAYSPSGISNGSKARLDDGQFAGLWTSTSPNNVILDFDYFTTINGINQTNIKITGIKVFLDGYATDSNVSISQCQLYNRLGATIILKGQNKCATPVSYPTSEQYLEWGSENDDWGTGGIDLSDIGIRFKFEYSVSPSTAYIDSIQMRVYYTYENQWNLKQDTTGYFDINFATNNIVYITTTGIFNVNGAYYLNGSPFSGGGAGDNLGNHIATTTLNMSGFDIVNVNSINPNSNTTIGKLNISYTSPQLIIKHSNGSAPLMEFHDQNDTLLGEIYGDYFGFLTLAGLDTRVAGGLLVGGSPLTLGGYQLRVNGGALITSSVTAQGGFYGDGSGLTNLPPSPGDNLGNHIATMTITANYGINASSINITGTGVSGSNPLLQIAGSTMVVLNNGYVGIGTNSPLSIVDIYKTGSSGWGSRLSIRNEESSVVLGTLENYPVVGAHNSGLNIWRPLYLNTNPNYLTPNYSYNERVIIGSRLGIGTNTPLTILEVNGTLRLTPTSESNYAEGMIYYDSALQKFRCYEKDTWKDCISTIDSTGLAVLSATQTWTGRNTYQGNSIFNSSITINANSSQQYALTIDTNNNASDGYVLAISTYGSILNRVWSVSLANNINYAQTETTLLTLTITTNGGSFVIIGKVHNVAPASGNRNYFYLYKDTTLIDTWIFWQSASGVIDESGVVTASLTLPAGTYTFKLTAKGESGTRVAMTDGTKLIVYQF
jgi:hypothetical protein